MFTNIQGVMGMSKSVRRFNVTRDKTNNIVNWFMAEAEAGSVSKIKKEQMKVICVPGRTSKDDKYFVLSNKEFQMLKMKNGDDFMNRLVLMTTAEMEEFYKKADVANRNRQKSGLLDVAYNLFNYKAKQIEQRFNTPER